MFMHMRSMLLYVICLLHVYVCYTSVILELDMLFVVYVTCLCMLYAVICCYMLYVCDMLYDCYMSSDRGGS